MRGLFSLFFILIAVLATQGQSIAIDSIHLKQAINDGTFPNITSVVVSKGGNLAFEAYYNTADENTLHNTRSATKTITGMLVGIAKDQGFDAHLQTQKLLEEYILAAI